ncbi:MAG: DUF4198 domain-containing protein [Rhodobacter sp.]|nr:DUF4198 domain-containing protein [Rhodobacter sp.]
MRLRTFVAAMLLAMPAQSHEFWISPETYSIGAQDQMLADIRVGQNFKGGAYSYLSSKFVRFDLVQNGKVIAVEGREGDRPALAAAAPGEGLVTIVHQTTDYLLTYSEAEKFVNFVEHKDFDGVLEQHRARGLPDTGFRERYSRYAKSLIAVGAGQGADQEVGMETEIVALANPYSDDLSGGLPVRVLYQGAVRADTQVELFERAPDGTVEVTKLRTDAAGEVYVPVKAGHEYLVDAVVMRPLEPVAENDPVWESLWASLTFKVPGE